MLVSPLWFYDTWALEILQLDFWIFCMLSICCLIDLSFAMELEKHTVGENHLEPGPQRPMSMVSAQDTAVSTLSYKDIHFAHVQLNNGSPTATPDSGLGISGCTHSDIYSFSALND